MALLNNKSSASLSTRISICEERYSHLEERMVNFERKLDQMSQMISQMRLDFFKIMIGTSGSVIVAIIGAVALILK